jgi:protein-L-isoaspartate(D-aspartate) O-methyltransferase
VRVTRVSEHEYSTEELADVRFVPLVGAEGWSAQGQRALKPMDGALAAAISRSSEKFASIEAAALEPMLERIGDSRVVLLGEASHGTSEFYRMRSRITRALIEKKDFSFVAIEGDWPDAARIDNYVRHSKVPRAEWTAFARFPMWMWRNREVREFVDWLRKHNAEVKPTARVAFHGLDLYSLYNSIQVVLDYLESVDPKTAEVARRRYGCLTPWQSDPAVYGHATLTGHYHTCEGEVTLMLTDLLRKRGAYSEHDGERFMDAVQNARLVANAEHYYRIMYYGSRASWNLRDSHMFETLKNLLSHRGPQSKAIVWAHNSHVGDSAATEMSARDEYNIGHLCREEYGKACYSVGFGTHSGTVAAASNWDEPMEVKTVRPSLAGSYERLCHETGDARFLLPLRGLSRSSQIAGLMQPKLERAIGVIYRPETELQSHYFEAVLPRQFDEYVWFDKTCAVSPLRSEELEGLPDTYPFGL